MSTNGAPAMPLPVTPSPDPKDNPPLVAGGAVGIVTVLVGVLAGMPVWAVVVIILAALGFTLVSQYGTRRA